MEIPLDTIQSRLDAAMKQNKPRPHMGCSLLGHPCDRWLWLSFRWAVIEKFPGRILRLFERGQEEEYRLVRYLTMAGLTFTHTGDMQKRVEFGAHVGGSVDGVITSGIPEAPHKTHIAEFKTHSDKSFNDLSKNGVQKSKPIHYAQMQLYMLGTDIDRALYVAVNKNDDSIYTERVKLDKDIANKLLARGKRIALSDRMPEPCSTDPSWYQCRFCPAHNFCHESHLTKEINCRTCAHSTAKEDSTWRCEKHDADGIPVKFQYSGCEDHHLHPDLVPWKCLDEGVWEINGKRVEGYSSHELLANPDFCAADSPYKNMLREQFGGLVCG